jgi:hypothetical protein
VSPPVNGPVEVRVEISNNTDRIVPLNAGSPAASDLADLLEALRRELRARRAPIAGRWGVARTLASSRPTSIERASLQVPFHVEGTVSFAQGSIAGMRVAGLGSLQSSSSTVAFDATVPSSAFPHGTAVIDIAGTATNLGSPRLSMRGSGVLPEASQLAPQGADTWRAALARGGAKAGPALALAERTMWQVLRLRELNAYLGNPGTGPATTSYAFTTARVAAPRAIVAPEHLKAGALALTLLAAALAITMGALVRSRS